VTIHRPSELQCQRTIVQAARIHGWLVHAERAAPTRSGGYATPIQGDAGWPDLVLARDGVCLIVELKRKPNKATLAQTIWLDELGRCDGITTMVVHVPEQMDAFIATLARPARRTA